MVVLRVAGVPEPGGAPPEELSGDAIVGCVMRGNPVESNCRNSRLKSYAPSGGLCTHTICGRKWGG
jgi:hypothetical protein